MRTALLLILVLYGGVSFAQNMVANPSFEVVDTCPNNGGQIYFSPPWANPTIASPDYFNVCGSLGYNIPNTLFGSELAHSGSAYSGIVTFVYCTINPQASRDYREYIQAPLLNTLEPGKKYCVKFYVSLGDSARFAANNIGAYFSDSAFSFYNDSVAPFTPQVSNPVTNPLSNKNGWTEVAGDFISAGGERYITIGNFDYDLLTDTLSITGADWCCWAYYFIDDISVTPCDTVEAIHEMNIKKLSINIYPVPSDGIYSIYIPFSTRNELPRRRADGVSKPATAPPRFAAERRGIRPGEIKIDVYDILGKLIYQSELTPSDNNIFSVDLSRYPNGTYLFRVNNTLFRKVQLIK